MNRLIKRRSKKNSKSVSKIKSRSKSRSKSRNKSFKKQNDGITSNNIIKYGKTASNWTLNHKKELRALSGLISLGALAGYSYKKSKYYKLLQLKNQLKNELIKNCNQEYVESFLNEIANDIFSSAYAKDKTKLREQLKKLNKCSGLVINNTDKIKPEITSIIRNILEFKN